MEAAETSGQNDRVTDWALSGLRVFLDRLPTFDADTRRRKAGLLWEELAHLEERRGKSVFKGEYTWTHYGCYQVSFDAAFVRLLGTTAWVTDEAGELRRPEAVHFEPLGWRANPFLGSVISFRLPIVEELARKAGIEVAIIDLLKELGVTDAADLRRRLGLTETKTSRDGPVPDQAGEPPLPEPAGASCSARTQRAG